MKKLKKTQPTKTTLKNSTDKIPFIEHIYELRKRLFYSAIGVVFFGTIGWFIRTKLTTLLLRPAAGQKFIYTSPGGGLEFNFRLAIYFGIALSLPIIIYQLSRYLEPLLPKNSKHLIMKTTISSCFLAASGMAFGYFFGLNGALHFFSHQFVNSQVTPLLTIQAYFSFVTFYLLGFALIFQLPLIMMLFNRIKPQKPRNLLRHERKVIMAGLLIVVVAPVPIDPATFVLVMVPIVGMYQIAILLIWLSNRRRKLSKLQIMQNSDEELRQQRLSKRSQAKLIEAPPLPAKPKLPQVSSLPGLAFDTPPVSNTAADGSMTSRYRVNRPVVSRGTPSYKPRQSFGSYFSDIRPSKRVLG